MNKFEISEKDQKCLMLRAERCGASPFTKGNTPAIRSRGDLLIKEMEMGNSEEVKQENRKIRYLRFLVDFSIVSIQQGDVSLGEALKVVEDVKRVACAFFPGKEDTFELIYRPRFNRAIQERFGTTAFIS
jgi:hypothetical protein